MRFKLLCGQGRVYPHHSTWLSKGIQVAEASISDLSPCCHTRPAPMFELCAVKILISSSGVWLEAILNHLVGRGTSRHLKSTAVNASHGGQGLGYLPPPCQQTFPLPFGRFSHFPSVHALISVHPLFNQQDP